MFQSLVFMPAEHVPCIHASIQGKSRGTNWTDCLDNLPVAIKFSIKISNQLHMHVFWLWVEAGGPEEDSQQLGEQANSSVERF